VTARPGPAAGLATLVAGAAAVSTVLVLVAVAPHGPGLSVDSASYELAAEHFRGARELVPLVLNGVFPPGYSAGIATAQVAAPEARDAALVVNLLGLAATLALVAVGLWQSRRPSDDGWARLVVPGVAVVLVATSPSMLRWGGYVMAEHLALAATMVAVVAGARALATGSLAWTAVAGAAVGGAGLARHGALATAAALLLVLLVADGAPWRARLQRSAALLAATGVVWLGGSWLLLGESPRSRRAVVWHPPGWGDLRQAADTLAGYWLPDGLGTTASRAVVALLAVAVGVLAVRAARRRGVGAAVPPLALVAGATLVAHVVALAASKALLDDAIVADDRLLLPLVPLTVVAIGALLPARPPRPMALLGAVAVLVVLGAQLEGTASWLRDARRDGVEYGEARFATSPTLAATRRLPEGSVVFTNDVALLSLRAEVEAFPLPRLVDPYTGQPDPAFADALVEVRRQVADGAIVVLVESFPPAAPPPADQLAATLGDVTVEPFGDGHVLRAAG
jgi:hypothetical protein